MAGATTLGQPLDFAVSLRLDPDDTLDPSCIRADVTSGERRLPPPLVRTLIEAAPSGERRIRVATVTPIDEPLVGIELRIGCPAHLVRSYTVFADPPTGHQAAGTVARPGEIPVFTLVPHSPVAAIVAAVPIPSPSAAAESRPARRPRVQRSARADTGTGAPAHTAGKPSRPTRALAARRTTAPRVAAGPALKLDPAEADVLTAPALRLDTGLSVPPTSASGPRTRRFVDPEMEQRYRDQERLTAMEAVLNQLRSDAKANQAAMAELQVRLRQAEAGRYANPLVYVLASLCAGLAAAVAILWWLRRRDRRAAAWWQPPAETAAPVARAAETPSKPVAMPPPPRAPDPAPEAAPYSHSAPTMPPPMTSPGPLTGDAEQAAEPRRPMSAEELIDLEQQAEFFVVLGQDDAAIDLLMGHLRSTGGVSPVPYLKLLEIYRRLADHDAYERIRDRFNRRFNAHAPEWAVPLDQGLELEGYAEVMSRLQAVWESPTVAMEVIEECLFRRNHGPTFDIPAYRELLFVYAIVRDLSEREREANGVDLLLPLDAQSHPTGRVMSSVMPLDGVDSVRARLTSLDLDITLEHPPNLLAVDRSPGKITAFSADFPGSKAPSTGR